MYECVGVDVGCKRRGREAEKGMVLDASTPRRSGEGVGIQMKDGRLLSSIGAGLLK